MSDKKFIGYDDACDLMFEDGKTISDSQHCFLAATVQKCQGTTQNVIFVYAADKKNLRESEPLKVMLPREFEEKYEGQVFHEVREGMSPQEAEDAMRDGNTVMNSEGTVFFERTILLPNGDTKTLVFFINPKYPNKSTPEVECELDEFHCTGEYEEYSIYEEEEDE